MKKALLVSLIAVLVLVVGCGLSTPTKTVVNTGEGNVVVTTESQGAGGWCPAGGQWKYAANVEQGAATGEWKVIGLESSGKYTGLCHVTYAMNQNGQNINVEYWFTENGESGFYQMDVNGQKIEQEWHK